MQEIKKMKLDLTIKDYKKASYYNHFVRSKKTLILMIIVFIAGIAVLLLGERGPVTYVVSIIFICYPLIAYGLVAYRVNQFIKAKKMPEHTPMTAEFFEDGFYITQHEKRTRFTWNSIRYFVKTKEHFFVYVDKMRMINLPLRCLEPEEIQYIEQLVVNHVSAKRRKITK